MEMLRNVFHYVCYSVCVTDIYSFEHVSMNTDWCNWLCNRVLYINWSNWLFKARCIYCCRVTRNVVCDIPWLSVRTKCWCSFYHTCEIEYIVYIIPFLLLLYIYIYACIHIRIMHNLTLRINRKCVDIEFKTYLSLRFALPWII